MRLQFPHLLLLCFVFLQAGCKKDLPVVPPSAVLPQVSVTAFLANEGNFGLGNADFSVLNLRDKTLRNRVYQTVNQSAAGDVMQSVSLINGKLFLVMNHSGCIHILDTGTYRLSTTIQGFQSPRYLCKINDALAVVSDLYARRISLLRLSDLQVVSRIPVSGWCEKMLFYRDKVYICNSNPGKVYVLDAQTMQLSDSIVTYKGCSSIQADKNGKLWVLCSGDYLPGFPSRIFELSVSPLAVVSEKVLGESYQAKDLEISPALDSLWWLYGKVQGMPVNTRQVFEPAISGLSNPYSLSCDPRSGHLWVSDALNYQQPGRLFEFSQAGEKKAEYETGVIPSQLTIIR